MNNPVIANIERHIGMQISTGERLYIIEPQKFFRDAPPSFNEPHLCIAVKESRLPTISIKAEFANLIGGIGQTQPYGLTALLEKTLMGNSGITFLTFLKQNNLIEFIPIWDVDLILNSKTRINLAERMMENKKITEYDLSLAKKLYENKLDQTPIVKDDLYQKEVLENAEKLQTIRENNIDRFRQEQERKRKAQIQTTINNLLQKEKMYLAEAKKCRDQVMALDPGYYEPEQNIQIAPNEIIEKLNPPNQ